MMAVVDDGGCTDAGQPGQIPPVVALNFLTGPPHRDSANLFLCLRPAMSSLDDPASQNRLSASLEKLRIEQDERDTMPEKRDQHERNAHDGQIAEGSSQRHHPGALHKHEGYGFRPLSGISTPMYVSKAVKNPETKLDSPLPDANGLGWPGEQPACLRARLPDCSLTAYQSKVHAPAPERDTRRTRGTREEAVGRSAHYPRMHRGGS